MKETPVTQEPEGSPPWFDGIDLDAVANKLNPLLREILQDQLPGELGAEIAAGMEVWQLDSYRQVPHEPPGDNLGEITNKLNQELWRILVEEYGVPKEQAERTTVRRWGLLAGIRNPQCIWRKCWHDVVQSWCWWKECCPCTKQ
jgi:hypothetical protein